LWPTGGVADSLDEAKAAFRGLHAMYAKTPLPE
jgi:hypothetical protein